MKFKFKRPADYLYEEYSSNPEKWKELMSFLRLEAHSFIALTDILETLRNQEPDEGIFKRIKKCSENIRSCLLVDMYNNAKFYDFSKKRFLRIMFNALVKDSDNEFI